MQNYYDILGISPEANSKEIEIAYQEIIQDQNTSVLSENIKMVKLAYETLINEEKRQVYDEAHLTEVKNGQPNISSIQSSRSPFANALILGGLALTGIFLGQLLAMFLVLIVFGFDLERFNNIIQNLPNTSETRLTMLFLNAIASLVGFTGVSILFLKIFDKRNLSHLNTKNRISAFALVQTLIITLIIMPFNALLIEWNMQMDLPDFLGLFENWAQQNEEDLKVLTEIMTSFANPFELFIGFFAIAIVPAIGEELLFRGMFQRKLSYIINPHVAIWLVAILFSAIHLQFYGFFPRMILGILFGYLYWWSGNIWIPIFAHFVNNGFTVLMVYLANANSFSPEVEGQSVSWEVSLFSLTLTLALLYFFYRGQQKPILA